MPNRATPDPILAASIAELVAQGCHTVILYGSRARGDWTEASDYDLQGLWDREDTVRLAHEGHGLYLDAFMSPATVASEPSEEYLKLRGGQVLLQRDGLGDQLLANVEARFAQGPTLWPPDIRQVNQAWAAKTLARVARGDVEGHYRRIMLLHQLLEDYFGARDQWYLGPKAGLAWLAEHDPEASAAFVAALAPDASLAALAALVGQVWAGCEDAAPPS